MSCLGITFGLDHVDDPVHVDRAGLVVLRFRHDELPGAENAGRGDLRHAAGDAVRYLPFRGYRGAVESVQGGG